MTAGVTPDAGTDFGRRLARRLREETVIWMTTVGADGTPQPNPVWFLWAEDGQLLVYNLPTAHRVAHIRQRPRVSLHFDEDGTGDHVAVLTGDAEIVAEAPPPHEMRDFVAKYRHRMARVSGSVEAFGAAYPLLIRVRITRIRGY